MPTVQDVVEALSGWMTGVPRSRFNQIARRLIDSDLLPKTIGRRVENATGAEVARLMFAVAHTQKIVDAPQVAKDFGRLPYKRTASAGGRDVARPSEVDPNWTLEDLIGRILEGNIDRPTEIALVRGVDGKIRAEVIVQHTPDDWLSHHFYTKPDGAGWGIRFDEEIVDDLKALFASTGKAG